MFRIVSIFILFIYLIPFTIFLDSKFIFEYFQVLIILLSFFVGGIVLTSTNQDQLMPVDYSRFYTVKTSTIYGIFILYFVINIGLYFDIFMHLIVYQDFAQWLLENTIARYSGETEPGAVKKISTILFMIFMVLLGTMGKQQSKKILFACLFMLLLAESTALSRATILMGAVACFTEILIRKNHFFSTLAWKKMIMIAFYVFGFLSFIFFTSAYLRVQNELNVSNILLQKVGEYLIAHYEALYIWMYNSEEYANTNGFSSFAGLFKILFGIEAKDGFYEGVTTQYGSTVIYTNIRGFLDDFGYLLTVVGFSVSGFAIKYFTFRKMDFFSYFFIRISVFLLLYMFYSPFLFATIIVGYLCSYLLIITNRIKY